MVKISKIQFGKKFGKNPVKPKFLNVIKLAQFSGAEACEKSKAELKSTQETVSLFGLQQKLNEIKDGIKEVIKTAFPDVTLTGYSIPLDLREKNITQGILHQLQNRRLRHKNYLKDITDLFYGKAKIPYANILCSDIPPKQTFTVFRDSMIMSPRLLVHYIKGENTISHYTNVEKLKKLYSSRSVGELFGIKKQILDEFRKYTNTDCLIPDGKFSTSQIKRLRLLAQKYDAVDELLKRRNIHTSAIEALFYSGIERCSKAGDILPNKDIMLGFSNVYDKHYKKHVPVILSFANTDSGYRFKAYRYDENLISNIEKYKKQVLHYIRTKNYKPINDLDSKIFEYLKTTEVSEVYVEPKDIKGLQKEMERCPDMTAEKLENLLKNSKNDTVYYIRNLKNYDVERYYNASFPLIKCLREFGKINRINEAYTEALAFDDVRHSPVGMYIRNGFEPISVSKEEIEKSLYTKAGFDYKRPVWLVYKL